MGAVGGVPLAESSALSFPPSPPLCYTVRLHTPACPQQRRRRRRRTHRLPRLSNLHAPAMHLDNLGSEGLDSSQDQLLVLQGGDAQTQHISAQTESKGVKGEKKSDNRK